MKRRDATFTFKERYDDLNRAYKKALSRRNFDTQAEAMAYTVNTPSSRFWVSAERLIRVINAIERNEPHKIGGSPLRREMFQELYSRYLQCKNDPQNRHLTKTDICYQIIYSEAPKFYIKPSWALMLFYKGRKKYEK